MPDEHERPAAPDSPLAGLRAKRKKALAGLSIDLKVQTLDGVCVRYRPIKQIELDQANERALESKDRDWRVTANAVVLANACIGVFEVDEAGEPIGTPSSWPRFDQELAHYLGIDEAEDGSKIEPTPVEIVRALYLKDGALINTAEALNGWSAPTVEAREQELAGN